MLQAAHEVLDQPGTEIQLLLRAWEAPPEQEADPKEMRIRYYVSPAGELHIQAEPELFSGISGVAMARGESQRIADVQGTPTMRQLNGVAPSTRAVLEVPVRSGRRIIGVLVAESPQVGAFEEIDEARFDRLAIVAALGLDNVRRQIHLRTLLDAAQGMTSLTTLQETFAAISATARAISPDVSPITIWLRDLELHDMWLGAYFGVVGVKIIEQHRPQRDSVVASILERGEPIWAEDAASEPLLGKRFRAEQGIRTCVALPLAAADEE